MRCLSWFLVGVWLGLGLLAWGAYANPLRTGYGTHEPQNMAVAR